MSKFVHFSLVQGFRNLILLTTNLYAQAEQETQKYALAAAIGAVGARFTARGPAPPTMLYAVAAAGVDRRSASADDDAQTV